MNYYNRHITDYRAATAHLSWDEDAAYNRLLDIYYATEKPLPADMNQVCRLARAAKPVHRAAVEVVLHEFFVLEADGWHQKRCEEEILIAGARARRARENGTQGGRPPKPKPNPEITQPVPDTPPDENPGGSYARASHSPFPIPQEENDAIASLENDDERSAGNPDRGHEGNGLARPAEPLRQAPRTSSGRGTRCPADWGPDEANCRRCLELGIDIEAAVVEFRNYWCALPGSKGLKLDWQATFYNRCSEIAGRRNGLAGPGRGGAGHAPTSIAEAARDVNRAIDER